MTTVDNKAHHNLVKKIIEELNKIEKNWTYDTNEDWNHYAIIKHESSFLEIALRDTHKQKIEVYCIMPRHADSCNMSLKDWLVHTDSKNLELEERINISILKEPKIIARDILKRLVLQYRPFLQIVQDKIKEEQQDINERNEQYKKVCELLNEHYIFDKNCRHVINHVSIYDKKDEEFNFDIEQTKKWDFDLGKYVGFRYHINLKYIPYEKLIDIVEILKK